jgi:hypothetical protein
MKSKSISLDHPFCNITGRQCRHCSEEKAFGFGGYCVIKTGETIHPNAVSKLGQRCNCESKWCHELDHCPLDDCVSPEDTWEQTIEKKLAVGQQELF